LGANEAPVDGVLYGRKNAAWVAIDTLVVRYDVAQSLNTTQQTQARNNIGAAPRHWDLGTY
jgi:hypothetical protein